MKSILFVGTFQSSRNQTKDVVETIALELEKEGFSIKLTSFHSNKLLRLLDILLSIIFFKGEFIHINTFSDQAFIIAELGSWLAKYRHKKVILTLHGGKLNEFERKNSARVQKVFDRAYRLCTPSLFLKEYFEKLNFVVHHIPNPLTLEKFPFKEKKDPINQYRILWVRAFGEIYRPNLAIQVLYTVRKSIPFATLTMIGPDKGLLNDCRQLALELKLEKYIEFAGPIPNHELHKYYHSHDCYINTPKYESFGVALMEAASCGIPIVSVSVGEIPYLWRHEHSIRLATKQDAECIATEVMFLAQNPSIGFAQAKNANAIVGQYEWRNIRYKWIDILNHDK